MAKRIYQVYVLVVRQDGSHIESTQRIVCCEYSDSWEDYMQLSQELFPDTYN